MARTDFASVDAYLAAVPEAARPALDTVRALLREAFPAAEEVISYQIPTFKVDGAYALYFAGYAGHYSLHPVTDGIAAALGAEIAPYRSGKGTLKFSLTEPVPVELIRRIAACRAAEIAAAPKKRARKKAAPAEE